MAKFLGLYLKTFTFTLLLMGVLNIGLYIFIDDAAMFEFINPIEEDWYMNAYFDDINKHSSDSTGHSDLVILSIEDSAFTRRNIAGVLQMLRKISPKPPAIVGIDIPFTDPYSDKESDSLLMLALQGLVDDSVKVVCAVTQNKDSLIVPPYFYKQIKGVHYGLTTHNNLDLLNYDSYLKGEPRFATKIAELSTGRNLSDMNSIIINYRNKIVIEGNPVISSSGQVKNVSSMEDLSGMIVLIGNENDQTDQKFLPFTTTENNQISGIRLIAYELCTLLAESKGYDKQLYHPYSFLPIRWFALLLIILSILYFILLLWEERKLSQLWAAFLEPILLIIFEFAMFIVCRCITTTTLYIPSFAYLIGFIAFMGFAYKIACKTNISSIWKKFQKSFRFYLPLRAQSK